MLRRYLNAKCQTIYRNKAAATGNRFVSFFYPNYASYVILSDHKFTLAAGLSVGLAGMAAGYAIGLVGDAGVRGTSQQPRLFVGMILILIFAEVLGLYGLIVALVLTTKGG